MVTVTAEDPIVPTETPKQYQLVGGELCLDFCNTVGGKRETVARENLHTYADFLAWCEQVKIVSENERTLLKKMAESNPDSASCVLDRAIQLREAIYRIFFAIAHQTVPGKADLAAVNEELSKTLSRLRVTPTQEHGYNWAWAGDPLAMDYPLGPLAHSAGKLLTSRNDLQKVRQCRGENCGWLFIDSSKNHSRCWCDMRDCGNRAKVRRHRARERAAG